MRKSELKQIIRECIEEVYLDEGILDAPRRGFHKVASKYHDNRAKSATEKAEDADLARYNKKQSKEAAKAYDHKQKSQYHTQRAKRFTPKK